MNFSAAIHTHSLKTSIAIGAVGLTAALAPAPASAVVSEGPALSALSLSQHAVHSGGAIKVTYRNSEPAITTLLVERRVTSKRHKTRWAAIGQYIHEDHAGINRVPFAARVGSHGLPAGSYRIRAASRDSAGLVSGIRKASFRVTR